MAEAPVALSTAQVKAFKAQAHHLSPVVMVGNAGLSDAVMREIDHALNAHELIKISAGGQDKAERKAMMAQICEALLCSPVQVIGKQLVLYRKAIQTESNEPHMPKKLAAQGVSKPPARGGKARAKPAKTKGRTDPTKLKRGPPGRTDTRRPATTRPSTTSKGRVKR